MADQASITRAACPTNVVHLPIAAVDAIRQPRGGAAAAFRKANPWPGASRAKALGPLEVCEAALHEARIAEANYRLASALCGRVQAFGTPAEAQDARDMVWRSHEAYQEATVRLAGTPATSAQQLRRKVGTIGTTWLGAEGAWYDALRVAVAHDAERLGCANPIAGKRVRRCG